MILEFWTINVSKHDLSENISWMPQQLQYIVNGILCVFYAAYASDHWLCPWETVLHSLRLIVTLNTEVWLIWTMNFINQHLVGTWLFLASKAHLRIANTVNKSHNPAVCSCVSLFCWKQLSVFNMESSGTQLLAVLPGLHCCQADLLGLIHFMDPWQTLV